MLEPIKVSRVSAVDFPRTSLQTMCELSTIYHAKRHSRSQVDFHTTESVVTVDWENGFVEASAKENINVSQIFKELLVQAKVKYNLSPALRRRRRQSLPTGPQGPTPPTPPAHNPHVPSPAQLAHLQQIRERHANTKRNSCVIS